MMEKHKKYLKVFEAKTYDDPKELCDFVIRFIQGAESNLIDPISALSLLHDFDTLIPKDKSIELRKKYIAKLEEHIAFQSVVNKV